MPATNPDRSRLEKAFAAGNFKQAFEGYRALALDPNADPKLLGDDLVRAVQCLQNLGRVDEIDDFREAVLKVHPQNLRLARAAAESLLTVDNFGFIVAGKFQRGNKRGGGQFVRSIDRDRAHALQVLVNGLDRARDEPDRTLAARFYDTLASTLIHQREGQQGWKLQALTDLAELPDYEPGWGYQDQTRGAPVDQDGTPIYYHVPKSFADAQSDGERWRWALAQAAEASPAFLNPSRMHLATFLHQQFGVQTLANSGITFDDHGTENNPFALQTLTDDETIARLATGIKRFKLPDEFNAIKLYRQVSESNTVEADNAFRALAGIFEDRRQYDRAADAWRAALKFAANRNEKQQRLDQILGRWGRFEPTLTQPAGRGAVLGFRYRNGTRVDFEAREILIPTLLNDVKAYVRSAPNPFDWQKTNLSNIGYRLVEQNETRYLGRRVAAWSLNLKPPAGHFDDHISVATPLQRPGAYLVTAKMTGGNLSRIVAWIADTVILKKPLGDSTYYHVADAVTGRPIRAGQRRVLRLSAAIRAERPASCRDSQLRPAHQPRRPGDPRQVQQVALRTQRIAVARHRPDGRRPSRLRRVLPGLVSGRSRRPLQSGEGLHHHRPPRVSPEVVRQVQGLGPGGSATTRTTPPSSPTGRSRSSSRIPGGKSSSRRPSRPTPTAGSTARSPSPSMPRSASTRSSFISLRMRSKGVTSESRSTRSPSTRSTSRPPKSPSSSARRSRRRSAPATISAHLSRRQRSSTRSSAPPTPSNGIRRARWDWLYGPGYWWFAHDYTWYPGWSCAGAARGLTSLHGWFGGGHQPPEVVAEAEVAIGSDGTVPVEIDTATAKAIHGDTDHKYQIVAEVVDQSRRTIVGTGQVTVAREPFKVFTWVDRGYYRAGDTIQARAAVRTPDRKPVHGKAALQAT